MPFRPVEDLAFAVARFFQRGGTFQNYYMVLELYVELMIYNRNEDVIDTLFSLKIRKTGQKHGVMYQICFGCSETVPRWD